MGKETDNIEKITIRHPSSVRKFDFGNLWEYAYRYYNNEGKLIYHTVHHDIAPPNVEEGDVVIFDRKYASLDDNSLSVLPEVIMRGKKVEGKKESIYLRILRRSGKRE